MKNNFAYTDISHKPYVFTAPSIRTAALCTMALLVPQLIMLAVQAEYRVFAVIAASVAACFGAELTDKLVRRRPRFDAVYPALTGLLIGMLLPETYPAAAAFILAFCTLLLTRYAFGGIAALWANPVAITIVIAFLTGSEWFPSFGVTAAELQSRNPSLQFVQNGAAADADIFLTHFLNDTIFRILGTSIPEGYFSFMWDSGSAIPAFRFTILTLAASIILLACGMLSWLVPVCCLSVYAVLVRIFGSFLAGGAFAQGDIFFAFCTGGTFFCAFFILPWFGTVPQTVWGKIMYGVSAGIAAFLLAGCGMSPVGMVYAVLAVNLLTPVIMYCEERLLYKKHAQILLPQAEALRRVLHD
ncbi:MAG TPA: RnfABCDGE type electron transport complex subunit D [Candidatus Treponema faecavium]|nr:RnfABCDGE type electron transport complex subunit D [Candidatus Treponema faecavium]